MDVRIVGAALPGRTFDDAPHDGCVYSNVHVGVQCRREVVDIVPGDAPAAEWSFSIGKRTWECPDRRARHDRGKRFTGLCRTEAAEDHLDRGTARVIPVTERVCVDETHADIDVSARFRSDSSSR